MDQTKPDIEAGWKTYKEDSTWYVKFTINATDALSGMDRVEMYINDTLYKNITGIGPIYEFVIEWSSEYKNTTFKFEAFDKAGNTAYKNISDVKSLSRSKSSTNQYIKIWLLRLLHRFPLFQKFIDII